MDSRTCVLIGSAIANIPLLEERDAISGEERAKAFAKAVQVFPPYNEFQQKTSRKMPVFSFKRVKEDA